MPITDRYIELRVGAPDSEYSHPFLQGMADRMTMSYFKYGRAKDAYPFHVDALKSLRDRIAKYDETGNTEYLMDVANFAMIEFMHPARPDAFFKATDADGSPGRRTASGRVSNADNDSLAAA